jgi:hypothetical protein
MAVDRNPTSNMRKRRALQQAGAGGITSSLLVNAPFSLATGRLALSLDPSGGLEVSSSLLRIKLIDTSLQRTASGLGVLLRTNPGLQISSGLGVLLDGTTLALGASGVKYANMTPYNPGASFTTVTANFTFMSQQLRMNSTNRATFQGTARLRVS